MKVTVSGVNGFVGVHLARDLVASHHEVSGLGKGVVAPGLEGLLSTYADVDLGARWPQDGADAIVHLAGLSAVGPSFLDPQGYLEGNSAPLTHLCEGLLAAGRTGDDSPRVVVVSTGAVYAPGVQINEESLIQVSSPYAVSKLVVETQCSYYRRRGLDIVVMRPFNHIGPGQRRGFLLPDLIEGVRSGTLTVGNLDTRRDYTDVRDVARSYRLAIEIDVIEVPVINVCSAISVSGREMLELLTRQLEVADLEITVDQTLLRPDDPSEIRGDNSLASAALGWTPLIDLETTVRDTVEDLVGPR